MEVYGRGTAKGAEMARNEVKLTIRVPKELHEAAKAKAEADDITLSQAIRWYLRAWVQGELSPTLPRSEPEQEGDKP